MTMTMTMTMVSIGIGISVLAVVSVLLDSDINSDRLVFETSPIYPCYRNIYRIF